MVGFRIRKQVKTLLTMAVTILKEESTATPDAQSNTVDNKMKTE